ncbi:unnamed protein product [Trifolium pratense]|uniref:Uncharacterized protein n=1 Tax=Trifolium pratense TaxID=57577 RepID=A0ACB0JVD5_TRIPR|nr:unnamed protein product [Trifolium pratense]
MVEVNLFMEIQDLNLDVLIHEKHQTIPKICIGRNNKKVLQGITLIVAHLSIVAMSTPSLLDIPSETIYDYFGIALSTISITNGSLHFKQWDPGGCSLKKWIVSQLVSTFMGGFSFSIEDSDKVDQELKQADSVVLTYACDRPQTLQNITTFWLPRLRQLQIRIFTFLVMEGTTVVCMLDIYILTLSTGQSSGYSGWV